jgi:NTE family protein
MIMRALVLAGGGSHGAFEAGVVAGLLDLGQHWDRFYGASIGALNAAVLCNGDDLHEQSRKLLALWTGVSNGQIYDVSWRTIADLLLLPVPLMREPAVFAGKKIRRLVYENLGHIARKPLSVTVTRLGDGGGSLVALDDGRDMRPWILASSAFPILFPPVEIDGAYFVDGGTVDNDPFLAAIDDGCTEIDVVLTEAPNGKVPFAGRQSLLTVAALTVRTLLSSHAEAQLFEAEESGQVTLRVFRPSSPPPSFLQFDPLEIQDMIVEGKAVAQEIVLRGRLSARNTNGKKVRA